MSNKESDKKKKSRPRLSIKIFSGSKKKDNLKKINEEYRSIDDSNKTQTDAEDKQHAKDAGDVAKENHSPDGPDKTGDNATDKQPDESAGDDTNEESDSDTSEEVVQTPPSFRPGRRRSLSACADIQDTRIKIHNKGKEDEEEENEDQLSPLLCSPTKSCLRGRSATFSFSGENLEPISRQRSVSFSPETVDPPPRNIKYRAWIEARCRPPPINVKHEKHKQKMSQLKKVNMSDYLASRKPTSGAGIMASSSSAFGGGGMMM